MIEGCDNALLKISKNNNIVLISVREKKLKNQTLKWLKIHNVPFVKLILVNTVKEKLAKMISCDLVIEDCLEVARMVKAHGVPVLLFDYPWNRIGKNIIRVKDWIQVQKFIEVAEK